MGVTTQTLMKEKFALQKTFNELNNRIKTIEKELTGMKANLSAVHGALQQVEKLIQYDDQYGKTEPPTAPEYGSVDKPALDIKPKEEPQQLDEGDK